MSNHQWVKPMATNTDGISSKFCDSLGPSFSQLQRLVGLQDDRTWGYVPVTRRS